MSIIDNEEELKKFIDEFERKQSDEYLKGYLSDFRVEELHETTVNFEPVKPTDDPLKDLVDEIHDVTGLDKDELYLCFLMNVSRNIGSLFPYRVEGGLIKFNPNLYALLIAPPNEFAKSTIIDLDEHLTKRIDKKADIIVERSFIGLFDTGLARYSSQLKGSEEKIADLIQEYHIMHFRAKEAGPSLDVDHQKAYAEGIIQILQELYNRETYDFNFRKQSAYIPEGQYVTLFGDLHPDELNGKLLRNGLIRRTVIVKKGYEDIDLEDKYAGASFFTDNENKFTTLKNIYVSMMASFVNNIVKNKEYMKIVLANDKQRKYMERQTAKANKKAGKEAPVDEGPRYVLKFEPDAEKYKITMTDDAKLWLMNVHLNARKRVKEEEVPRYPSENYELINRIAINIMLFESVYYKQIEGPFIVEVKHLEKALSFVKRIEQGYIDEIKKIENQPIEAKIRRLVSLIEKRFTSGDEEKGTTWSDLLRLLKYDSQELRLIVNNAIERDMISCATIIGNGRKPSLWFYPTSEERQEKVFQALTNMQKDGIIKEFSFPADLSVLKKDYNYRATKR